jgi:hypothetical protein
MQLEMFPYFFNGFQGVKGSRPGCTKVTVLLRGDTSGPLEGSSYSPGVTDAEYSLSSPKTVCAW